MSFVHGHPRESGWVVSHYRRPQHAGDDQLDLALPAPRAQQDEAEQAQDDATDATVDADDGDGDPDERAKVRSIPRRTASTR
ncbi:hypothetical protein GCM10023203_04840 [Actinomycetospora straminea]|uniref:Uncharacterized protein n=1 Tax=Actinomycetospora straminea TaxID=663607 RepID=A0ABP9DYP0_9PSEU